MKIPRPPRWRKTGHRVSGSAGAELTGVSAFPPRVYAVRDISPRPPAENPARREGATSQHCEILKLYSVKESGMISRCGALTLHRAKV